MEANTPSIRRWHAVALAALLVYALALRLWINTNEARGFQIDEASNAWNAWSLLHTGMDEWSQRWPIVAERAYDDFRSTLYIWLLVPAEWIGGMNPITARLPNALAGAIGVALLFPLSCRLFDRSTAIVAGAFLAIMPWHLLSTDLALEAGLSPTLLAAVLLAILSAGAPLADRTRPPRLCRALMAGALIGVSLYGYAALRVLVPILLLGFALAHAPAIGRLLKTQGGRRAAAGLLLMATTVAAPLLWRHLIDSQINTRATENVHLQAGGVQGWLMHAARRYTAHFQPTFLFNRVSSGNTQNGPDSFGCIQWFWTPPLLVGLIVTLLRARRSASARTLLVLTAIYPLANALFSPIDEPNAYYANIGVLPLSLLAAVGCAAAWRALPRRLAVAAGMVFAIAAIISHVEYVLALNEWNASFVQHYIRYAELTEAFEKHADSWRGCDAAYCTCEQFVFPYGEVRTATQYDPLKWQADVKEFAATPPPLLPKPTCWRFGKIRFIYDRARVAAEIAALPSGTRVMMVLRPEEAELASGHPPRDVIFLGRTPRLFVYDFER